MNAAVRIAVFCRNAILWANPLVSKNQIRTVAVERSRSPGRFGTVETLPLPGAGTDLNGVTGL